MSNLYSVYEGKWYRGATYGSRPRPWVARIVDLHPKYKFAREFIKPITDTGFRAINTCPILCLYFAMPPGVYEISQPIPRTRFGKERAYVLAFNGDLKDISESEVLDWLRKNT